MEGGMGHVYDIVDLHNIQILSRRNGNTLP